MKQIGASLFEQKYAASITLKAKTNAMKYMKYSGRV